MKKLFHFSLFTFHFSLLFFLTSCEKEIDLDYHQVNSLYVAEALMTGDGTQVRLTTTQDMTDNESNAHNVTGAIITVSYDGEVMDTLNYTRNGFYTSKYRARVGREYTVDIFVDDHHFQSSSTMQQAPVMNSFRFVWKKVLSERMLFADLKLQDHKGENNYYFMHIYRNNIGYRWAVMNDTNNPGEELQQLFSCTTERNMDKNDDDGLQDGDKIHVEIRSIDRRTYDYFYSMQVQQQSGTNPVANYTGGCLGYFSACYVVSFDTTFQRSEVETE